ncbi:hypothetical protein [Streptomyces sp. NPDC060022]|uniref:hypothetical protein n=1 Tax=Streptomyces sp. NPDC060022 TaxID=3347039 RepID=UPI0036BCEBB9
MAVSEDLLWDAADKSTRIVPRLRRMAVIAGSLGIVGLVLWVGSDVRWAVCAAAAYVLVEVAHWAWDRRRLVEARIVVGEPGDRARLRLRHVGGRITEHDPHQVAQVLIIHDNVDDSAKLRLRLRREAALLRASREFPGAHDPGAHDVAGDVSESRRQRQERPVGYAGDP